jgi:hypothetical protein
LNKYWRKLTYEEFLWELDIPQTNDAIEAAQFPEHISKLIWEVERKPFEVF